MINDLKYTVRSREIIDLISSMRSGRLTLASYFQRNLVWRDMHKRDFIETILKGYPFPQIFLARGTIDLESMTASQAVVDGQQRLNSIRDFVDGKLDVNGKFFSSLSEDQRRDFLKYEVPIIDFDLDVGDAKLIEVFQRLNRTFYALTAIEKIASEYSSSAFLLLGRLLCGDIIQDVTKDPEIEEDFLDDNLAGNENIYKKDPGISADDWVWIQKYSGGEFSNLIVNGGIFSAYEHSRKVPLMYALNIACTIIDGYYERNNLVKEYLDLYSDEFEKIYYIIEKLNQVAAFISSLDISSKSMWYNKANIFTLICELARFRKFDELDSNLVSENLTNFSEMAPENYRLAAREASGRKPQRELRGEYIRDLLNKSLMSCDNI